MIGLPDSNKGGAKRHILVQGPWAGLREHPKRDFGPNFSLKIPGMDGPECSFSCFFFFSIESVPFEC